MDIGLLVVEMQYFTAARPLQLLAKVIKIIITSRRHCLLAQTCFDTQLMVNCFEAKQLNFIL